LKQLNNTDLNELAKKLPTIAKSSKSENSIKKYSFAFNKFKSWCTNYNLYTSVLYSAYYGIKWEHDLNLFTSIFSEQFIKSVRILSKPVQKKEPITSDILKTILWKQYPIDNLQKLRICCLLLLGYAGFLRFNELAQIRASNLKFSNSHLEILIERSKTDVYRQGHTVVIARTNNDTCPVAMCEKYLLKADIALDSDDFIFRSLSFFQVQRYLLFMQN
jgi:site-specific recombinase XerD